MGMTEVAEIRAAVCKVRISRDVGDIGGLFSRVENLLIKKGILHRGISFDGMTERIIGLYMVENGLRDVGDVHYHLGSLAEDVHLREPRDSQEGDWFYAQDKFAERVIKFYEKWDSVSVNRIGAVDEEYMALGEEVRNAVGTGELNLIFD